jgi:hypothetical protein
MLLEIQPGNDLETQIPQRLILLANAFESVGKYNDGFFLLCLALKMEISREGVPSVSREVDALEFLANKSDGIFPPAPDTPVLSKGTLSICRRMALCLLNPPKMESTQNDLKCFPGLSYVSIFDDFVQRFRDGIENSLHPISSIEFFFLGERHRKEGKKRMSFLLSLVEILTQLGHSIRNFNAEIDTNSSQSETARQTHSLLSDVVRKLAEVEDQQYSHALRCMLDIIISVSITPYGRQKWTSLDLQICRECPPVIQDHYIELKDLSPTPDADYLLDSFRLVIHSLLLAKGVQSFDEVFPLVVEGARGAVERSQSTDHDNFLVAKRWVTWTVSNVMSLCDAAGYKEKATVLSSWLVALTENDYTSRVWYTSTLLSTTAYDVNMTCLAEASLYLAPDSKVYACPTDPTQWLFETELNLCRLHVKILSSGADCSSSYNHQAQFLEDVFQQLSECSVSNKDQLLHLWVMSTLCLVNADLSASFGYFPSALIWTHRCVRNCQAIMKLANVRFQGNSSMVTEAAASSILVRAALRYIQVLSKRPRLHYRLGDYRKADTYMRSVLDFLKIHTGPGEGDKERPNQLKQLVRSLNAAPEVRLFLEMASWASTPEHTIEDLSTDSPSFGPLDRHLPDSNTSLVETIQNLVAGKCVTVQDAPTFVD